MRIKKKKVYLKKWKKYDNAKFSSTHTYKYKYYLIKNILNIYFEPIN